jgi:MOSC domain-containing protein YiiM
VLEVTPQPHNGCAKYSERFGADALRVISRPEARDLHLRGIYFRVVEDGDVAVGDTAEVLR